MSQVLTRNGSYSYMSDPLSIRLNVSFDSPILIPDNLGKTIDNICKSHDDDNYTLAEKLENVKNKADNIFLANASPVPSRPSTRPRSIKFRSSEDSGDEMEDKMQDNDELDYSPEGFNQDQFVNLIHNHPKTREHLSGYNAATSSSRKDRGKKKAVVKEDPEAQEAKKKTAYAESLGPDFWYCVSSTLPWARRRTLTLSSASVLKETSAMWRARYATTRTIVIIKGVSIVVAIR